MDRGVFVNSREMNMCQVFLRKTPVIYTCRNLIHHHLFSNGIVFSHRRGRIKHDPHMQEIMSDFWLPFCRDMVDQIMAIGFAVIRLVKMEDGLRIPVIIDPSCCRVKMLYSYGTRDYLVLDDQQEEIPDTFVLDTFGYSPTPKGSLTSVVVNLLPQVQYVNTLRGTSLVMEQKRAEPVIMTETVDTKADNIEGIQYDYYADGDMQDTSDHNKFVRNRNSVQALAEQQDMYDNFFTNGQVRSKGSNVLDNVVTLPLGHKIVNVPQQTGRGDLVAQVKAVDDVICAVMGVPRSLVMADTPHKSDSEGTHQTFQKTVNYWKHGVQTACEQVYNIIYADSIKKQMMESLGKKRKRSTVEDVYALKKKMQVEITFPISPFISLGQLHAHYTNGVLPWDTYVRHACASSSLPYVPVPEPTQSSSDDQADSDEKSDKKKEKDDQADSDEKSDKKKEKDGQDKEKKDKKKDSDKK